MNVRDETRHDTLERFYVYRDASHFVSTVTVYANEGVLDNTSESVFSISGEVWLYKACENKKKTWYLLHGLKFDI